MSDSSAIKQPASEGKDTAGDGFQRMRESGFMPPPEKTVIAPEGGWKGECYYEVVVSSNRNNPCHRSILYTGFLNDDKTPGAYSAVWNPTYDGPESVGSFHYIWAKRLLMRGSR